MVTEDIGNLKISGRLYESSAQMRFFIRNVRINNGDATFDDFYATDTPISLMNVQVFKKFAAQIRLGMNLKIPNLEILNIEPT